MSDGVEQGGAASSAALRRVLTQVGGRATLDSLVNLAGADLTTLLLEVMRRRARKQTAPELLRRYRADRFVSPADTPFPLLRDTEHRVLSALPSEFELLTLSPVAPLGTNSVPATVDQNKVISAIRGTEVAADPTNALALEAAVRRAHLLSKDARSADVVRLAAIQRVVRAQPVAGQASFAHFTLAGVVSAGRDIGNSAFERHHALEHLRFMVDAVGGIENAHVEIGLTCLEEQFAAVAETIAAELSPRPGIVVIDDPHRTTGRGYYHGFCFRVAVVAANRRHEVGDGGFVDWTRKLLGNRKERLLISGLGIDRLAYSGQFRPPEPPT
ncbi:hypothetical protein [Nocardia arthritidis]|uniref:Uncharacterized protein n=1 Tax=Nocardia arthritidis TaxID=228602 RepID=A0A6G9YLT9_9NOCA|nr:hypothetical protein [Nocardia arthritidis]QIS14151.1 hypothetical protein F5544_31550 [Nocardia arthritidis]